MSSPEDTPFIRIRGLQKTIGSQHILRGVNLDVNRGETLVLIGPSGEGKSVMLKHIIGLMTPTEGSIEINGVDIGHLKERQLTEIRKKIGFLFQNAALFDSMDVARNVGFPLRESGLRDKAEIDKRVMEALELVELGEHAHKMPINLSGGMRKRVGIARAIVSRPDCILYDEPTSGLDPIVTDVIDLMIRRLQKRFGVTSIVVTHDMGSVFKVADRVALLKGGVVHFSGTTDDLRASKDSEVQDFIAGRSGMSV